MKTTYIHIAKKMRKDQEMITAHRQLTFADNITYNEANWNNLINPRHHLLRELLEITKEAVHRDVENPLSQLPCISHQSTNTIPIEARYLLVLECVVAFVDLKVMDWPGGDKFRNATQTLWPKIHALTTGDMINSYHKGLRNAQIKLKLEHLEAFLLYMIYHSCDETNGIKMEDEELVVVAKSGHFFVSMILEGFQRIV